MTNIVVINGCNLTEYAKKPLGKGDSALKRGVEFGKKLPHVSKTVFLTNTEDTLPDDLKAAGIETVSFSNNTPEGLIHILKEVSAGSDHIFYYYGDCPLLDAELTGKMYENHTKYFADYTFSDGYPYGITPEILQASSLSMMEALAGKVTGPLKRDSIFSIIQKDINSFDLETEISPEDLRLLRILLTCDTKRNFLLTQKIVEDIGEAEIEQISSLVLAIITQKGDALRTLPAFYNIQVSSECPQQCAYCPFPGIDGSKAAKSRDFMGLEKFSAILDSIQGFSEDAVISLSLWGEPSLNPEIEACIEEVIKRPGFSLVIETSGIGWDPDILQRLSTHAEKGKISWIISLDALNEDIYNMMREKGRTEAWNTAEHLLALFKEKFWVQAIRTTKNEEDLEHFFRFWKEKTENVIIQKYDWFCGNREQLKVTDLSPFKRDPCWHVKRDMNILIDGTVPLCREDLEEQYILGNILIDNIEKIWLKGNEYYKQHLDGTYNNLCGKCDEYYTYNF